MGPAVSRTPHRTAPAPTWTRTRGSGSRAVGPAPGDRAPILQHMTDSPDDPPIAVSPRLAVALAIVQDRRDRRVRRLLPVLGGFLATIAV